MHFLLVTFEAGGNIPFEMSLARTLISHGHEVTILANRTLESRARDAGATLVPFSQMADYDIRVRRDVTELADTLVNRFMFGDFVALDVVACCERLDVAAVLVDSLLYAALAGAECTGRPTVSLWHTVMSDERRPYHNAETLNRLNQVRAALDLSAVSTFHQQLDVAALNLGLTMENFDAPDIPLPRNFVYAGPMVEWGEPDPAWRDNTLPLVVVSFSTMYLSHQAEVIQRVLDAVSALKVRILLTLGDGLQAEDLAIPFGVTWRRYVPHSEVLPYAELIVTHGGYGSTVAAALSGTPILCLPLTEEEGAVGERIVSKGFGRCLPAEETSVAELRRTVEQMLADGSFAARASAFSRTLSPQDAKSRAVSALTVLG